MLDDQIIPSPTELQAIANDMLALTVRLPYCLDSDTHLDKLAVIQWANQHLSQQNCLMVGLGTKINSVLLGLASYRESVEMVVDELSESVEERAIEIESLQETVTHLQGKVVTYQQEYSKLKHFTQNLSEQYEQSCAENSREQELTSQVKDLQSQLQQQQGRIESFLKQKQLLLAQVSLLTTKTHDISRQRNELAKILQQKLCTITQQSILVSDLAKQKDRIRINLTICQQALSDSQEQLSTLKQQLNSRKTVSDRAFKKINHPHSQSVAPLQEQLALNHRAPYPNFYYFHWPGRGEGHQGRKGQAEVDVVSFDPYFAHFALTSQSVKIREDCEQLLNIDVKPFYGEIVEKRVPMHLWDQWIRNKLRELHRRNRKRSSGFTSEEEL